MEMDEITGAVIDVAVQAHRVFGPRLLESLYESVLACELRRRGLSTERQRLLKISYDGIEAKTPSGPTSSSRNASSSR
jgi:GxxExxY protein